MLNFRTSKAVLDREFNLVCTLKRSQLKKSHYLFLQTRSKIEKKIIRIFTNFSTKFDCVY